MGVRKGEQYRLKDLLYGLMLESYNDAAVMIAEFIGGTREGFAAMMNEKARELGCKDTWFITPNGLDAQETDEKGEIHTHSTTAKDLARILLYCIQESPKKEEFLKITRTQNHGFYDLENKRQIQCRNHNALLDMMDGALTGKTGFTGGAGYSYVGALEKNGKLFIIALLGCGWPPHKTWKWSDARSLLSYGMENYEKTDLYERCQKTEPLPVKSRWRHLLGRAASGPCAGKGRFTIRGKTCLCSGKKRGKTGKKGVPAKAAAGSCKRRAEDRTGLLLCRRGIAKGNSLMQ